MKRIPTMPATAPTRNPLSKSAGLYIRFLTCVISGSTDKVVQNHLVFFAAGASAGGDAFPAQEAGDFDSAVIPAVDQNVAEVGQRCITHRAGTSPAFE
jgi:hypothetical protein